MRHNWYVLAALLGLAVPAAGTALAFEVNTVGTSNPEVAPLYSDSDAAAKEQEGKPIEPIPGLQFSTSATGNRRVGGGADNNWQFLQPMGRLTR